MQKFLDPFSIMLMRQNESWCTILTVIVRILPFNQTLPALLSHLTSIIREVEGVKLEFSLKSLKLEGQAQSSNSYF